MRCFPRQVVLLFLLTAPSCTVVEQQPAPFKREYAAEIIRYAYRWHLDETQLHSVQDYDDCEFWVRPLEVEQDADDNSRFLELLAPRLKLRAELKKADYEVEELGLRIQNDNFRILSVSRYEERPAHRKAYRIIRFDRKGILDYLFRTRNEFTYPDEDLRERLRAALREHLSEEESLQPAGPQTVYVAPLSAVSNDLWVFWENDRKIIRFSSDADMTTKAYWEYDDIGVEVYDLDEDVVVSLAEVGGSNAYVTRDWASRVLFNCVALGEKLILTPTATLPAP